MGVEFSPLVRPRVKELQVSVLKSTDVNIGEKTNGGEGRPEAECLPWIRHSSKCCASTTT